MKAVITIDLRLTTDERYLAILRRKSYLPFLPAAGHILEFDRKTTSEGQLDGPQQNIAQFGNTDIIKVERVRLPLSPSHVSVRCVDPRSTMQSFSFALNELISNYGFTPLVTDKLWVSMIKR